MFKKKKKRGDYSRREFLYLMLGGSATLLGVGACGVTAWAMQPQLRWGVDLFRFDPTLLPPPETDPIVFAEGNLFLCNTSEGATSFRQNCPYDGVKIK